MGTLSKWRDMRLTVRLTVRITVRNGAKTDSLLFRHRAFQRAAGDSRPWMIWLDKPRLPIRIVSAEFTIRFWPQVPCPHDLGTVDIGLVVHPFLPERMPRAVVHNHKMLPGLAGNHRLNRGPELQRIGRLRAADSEELQANHCQWCSNQQDRSNTPEWPADPPQGIDQQQHED